MKKLGEIAKTLAAPKGQNSQAKGLVSDRTLERRQRTDEVNLSGKRTGARKPVLCALLIFCIQD